MLPRETRSVSSEFSAASISANSENGCGYCWTRQTRFLWWNQNTAYDGSSLKAIKMSIEQKNTIDIIAADKDSAEVRLFITDHLPWDESAPDHLLMLQDKINTYLSYIESGEILERYPFANEKSIIIQVLGKFQLNPIVERFYKSAAEQIKAAGFELMFEYKP